MLTAIRADALYDGLADQPLAHRTVVIKGRHIDGVVPGDPALPADAACIETPILAPGFVDMQINGAGDVLFNDRPDAAAISKIAAGARLGGSAYILPTFITAKGRAYRRALEAVSRARADNAPGILGVHLEGPFLSPHRPGIHEQAAIRGIEAADLDELSAWKDGVGLLTLAPEEQPAGTIERLSGAGWLTFAGHSEATFEDVARAAGEGLRGVTHLFNAMRQVTPREPGLVGSVLDDQRLFAGIIADGHHVHPANLRLAAACLGAERLCLVTDAMPTLGGSKKAFALGGSEITLRDGRLTDAAGTLAGAHLSMIDGIRTMTRLAGVPLADALRMASTTPARALGLGAELGRIASGFRAGLTLLDHKLDVQAVFTDGRRFDQTSGNNPTAL